MGYLRRQHHRVEGHLPATCHPVRLDVQAEGVPPLVQGRGYGRDGVPRGGQERSRLDHGVPGQAGRCCRRRRGRGLEDCNRGISSQGMMILIASWICFQRQNKGQTTSFSASASLLLGKRDAEKSCRSQKTTPRASLINLVGTWWINECIPRFHLQEKDFF